MKLFVAELTYPENSGFETDNIKVRYLCFKSHTIKTSLKHLFKIITPNCVIKIGGKLFNVCNENQYFHSYECILVFRRFCEVYLAVQTVVA